MILITGITGIIGRLLLKDLSSLPYPKKYIVRKYIDSIPRDEQVIWDLSKSKNLLVDYEFKYVIHMSAIAHSVQSKSENELNFVMTKNLVSGLRSGFTMVFFSSISVYGEFNKKFPIGAFAETKPSSPYGRSKVACEEYLRKNVGNLSILRLCPMIEGDGVRDLKKRAFIPLTKIKLKSPYKREFSFSTSDSIFMSIREALNSKPGSVQIRNVADERLYSEDDVLNFFEGHRYWTPPKILTDLLFGFCVIFIRQDWAYSIYCNLHKLLKTNTFE